MFIHQEIVQVIKVANNHKINNIQSTTFFKSYNVAVYEKYIKKC